MYGDLINVIRKTPDVYETTGVDFWNDAHISKYMLQAHLASDSDEASRNHTLINKSADWISALLKTGETLLDLGCGPGLYAEAFAQNNFRVTGMDFSPEELTADLQDAGFSSVELYGDILGKPLDKDDVTICVVGKK